MRTHKGTLKVSFLLPVYNEEKNIQAVYHEILRYVDDVMDHYEFLFINDSSSDGTLHEIIKLQEVDSNVHYLSLSRNFGHQNALKAGYDFATGDIVISLDGDMQHPPALIPEMIALWRKGYDVIITNRRDKETLHFLKRLTSKNFYRIFNKISELNLKPGTADFRLLDKKVVAVLKQQEETDLFFRGYVAWSGFRQHELLYTAHNRVAGETKYTLRKMMRLASSGLLGFSVLPLRVVSLLGFLISGMSFFYGFYAIFVRLFSDSAISGWASVMSGIYFLGGIQLICLGICGEYIGRIFMQVKKRPHYIIADTSLPKPTE